MRLKFFFVLFLSLPVISLGGNLKSAQEETLARGIIFHDQTGDQIFNKGRDVPLEGVPVSNGREIVLSDSLGFYEIPVRHSDIIFVIKPPNWTFLKDQYQNPLFYYIHAKHSVGGTRYEGLSSTRPFPESIDFPLYPSDESETFDVLILGDTQPRNMQEIVFMARDALPELVGIDVAFGATLGDVVFDDLSLFTPVKQSLATSGLPFHYILGNHDLDYSASCNNSARGSWFKNFGPSYYSFTHGNAHFIVLDNIRWIVELGEKQYKTGLGSDQMNFLRKEVSRIDEEKLLVLLAHIPWAGSTEWIDEQEKKDFMDILSKHPNSVSLTSHRHRHHHLLIDQELGFPGEGYHHMVVVGTVCGAWWQGVPDEYGIPHAMMSDGTPTSYSILHIDNNSWKLGFKATRRPEDFQMHIHSPDVMRSDETVDMTVRANIFNALPTAEVKMRVGENMDWIPMERHIQHDPVRAEAMEREQEIEDLSWRRLGRNHESEHIWQAKLGHELEPGAHVIYIKATDEWWDYHGRKIVFVEP